MSAPERIRLQRTKGWRMPENTVKVDRSTDWGNPFVIGAPTDLRQVNRWGWIIPFDTKRFIAKNAEASVAKFRECLLANPEAAARVREHLSGTNLACWCETDKKPWIGPCHADVLLELANATAPERPKVSSEPLAKTE